jgi:hypothetical protein
MWCGQDSKLGMMDRQLLLMALAYHKDVPTGAVRPDLLRARTVGPSPEDTGVKDL